MRLHHENCLVEVSAWGERGDSRCDDAEVWIEGEAILISYLDDEGLVVLEGRSDGEGGWTLAGRSRPWRASLEPAPGEARAWVGEIEEQGERGRWRLRLAEAEAEVDDASTS